MEYINLVKELNKKLDNEERAITNEFIDVIEDEIKLYKAKNGEGKAFDILTVAYRFYKQIQLCWNLPAILLVHLSEYEPNVTKLIDALSNKADKNELLNELYGSFISYDNEPTCEEVITKYIDKILEQKGGE